MLPGIGSHEPPPNHMIDVYGPTSPPVLGRLRIIDRKSCLTKAIIS